MSTWCVKKRCQKLLKNWVQSDEPISGNQPIYLDIPTKQQSFESNDIKQKYRCLFPILGDIVVSIGQYKKMTTFKSFIWLNRNSKQPCYRNTIFVNFTTSITSYIVLLLILSLVHVYNSRVNVPDGHYHIHKSYYFTTS